MVIEQGPRQERPCPFLPCLVAPVRLYQSSPGGPVDMPVIEPHNVNGEAMEWGRACPASGHRLPISPRVAEILERERHNFVTWRTKEMRRQGEASFTTTEGLPEHSLTPHPTADRQWFLTGPERKARGMASVGEVKAAIGHANVALAEGQELARAAAGKFAEAKAVLGGIRQDTMQELGLMTAGEALKSVEDAATYAAASIELNAQFGGRL